MKGLKAVRERVKMKRMVRDEGGVRQREIVKNEGEGVREEEIVKDEVG